MTLGLLHDLMFGKKERIQKKRSSVSWFFYPFVGIGYIRPSFRISTQVCKICKIAHLRDPFFQQLRTDTFMDLFFQYLEDYKVHLFCLLLNIVLTVLRSSNAFEPSDDPNQTSLFVLGCNQFKDLLRPKKKSHTKCRPKSS